MNPLDAALQATDSIVAVSTPAGRGAIGVVRVSGSAEALDELAEAVVPGPLPARQLALRRVEGADGRVIDRALVVRFVGPQSYTGEDILEVHLHGNPVILRACVESFVVAGARHAQPGEFTRRAVAHGRLDLVEAEAVDAVVRAESLQAVRSAQRHLGGQLSLKLAAWRDELLEVAVVLEALVDFPEDVDEPDLERRVGALGGLAGQMQELAATFAAGRRLAEGARVVLSGPVNAGKSTLFNRLLGHDRAIVTPHAGTTRDVVSEPVDWGLPVRLEDTAGRREAVDPIEAEGVARSERAADDADLVVHVRDARCAPTELPGPFSVATHCDLAECPSGYLPAAPDLPVADLRAQIVARLTPSLPDLLIHSERQKTKLSVAAQAAREASEHGAQESVLCATSVRDAATALEELLGAWTPDTVLDALFSRFCIGK